MYNVTSYAAKLQASDIIIPAPSTFHPHHVSALGLVSQRASLSQLHIGMLSGKQLLYVEFPHAVHHGHQPTCANGSLRYTSGKQAVHPGANAKHT
jgi:hypothetical protein